MKRRAILTILCLSLLVPVFAAASQYRQRRHRSDSCLYRQHPQEATRPIIRSSLPSLGRNGRGDRICFFGGETDRNLRDADGDGIPNGRDPDFTRGFVDENRDGICDHRQSPGNDAINPD